MLPVEWLTLKPPVLVNRLSDVMSTVDDSCVTICEFLWDWAADVTKRPESGCWSDSGVTTDVMLYVMRSADCAADETICELI